MERHRIDKATLRETITSLEGLTNEQKADLLQLLSEQKRYGLVWEDHAEDVEEQLRTQLPVLCEDDSKRILSTDAEAPNHVLIEGDNLHVLTALTYTHEGRVDVIYIDPPYNRGEKDFKYNDKYIDPDNPFKHSLWLSFMYKRLKIAKRLLSDRGVLIVHIDEHEYDALHLLLETDIFTSTNDMGMIIWNKLNPKGDAHNVAVMHEYIMLFCKNRDFFVNSENALMRDKPNAEAIIKKGLSLWSKLGKTEVPTEVRNVLNKYKYPSNKVNEFSIEYTKDVIIAEFQNWLKKSEFSKGEKAYKFLDKQGQAFRTVSMAWPNKDIAPQDYWVPLVHPITGEVCPLPSKGWRNSLKTMKELIGEDEPIIYNDNFIVQGEIAFTRKKNGQLNIPERVYYLKDNMMENVSSIYNDGSSDEQLLLDLQISFPYPKCLSVAKYLLKNVLRDKNSLILDFFAGSGTTLHATMQLNAEDGGRRQCILVTNNENGICENVTYERNRRVIQGYTTPKGVEVPGLSGNNLRYYRTDFVERETTRTAKRQLMMASTELLCIKHDIYDEQPTFGSITLRPAIARYFADEKQQMLIIYRTEAIESLVAEIAQMPESTNILVYVFSTNNYAMNADFETVSDKVTLCALPAAIYNAYLRVLPKRSFAKDDAMRYDDDNDNMGGTEA